jgi:hypothetical protein
MLSVSIVPTAGASGTRTQTPPPEMFWSNPFD